MKSKAVDYEKCNIYFQDESRFGLFTRNGKSLTLKGVKPISPFVQDFKNSYLFGAFSPINGDKLLLEMPYCNTECFEVFLEELSKQNEHEFKVLVLDNGAFHKAKRLEIPKNIALCFIPPYSPELNPAEKVWAFIKNKITNKIFKTLDELGTFISKIIIENLNTNRIKSITKTSTYNVLYNPKFKL
ncbi:MAG: IS630 family transposase [Dolichospermum sp.]